MKLLKTTILTAVAAAALGLTLPSCSDSFLDVTSKTGNNSGSITTPEQAESMLYGCYDAWKRTSSDDTWGFYVVSEIMSDECFAGTGTSDAPQYAVIDRFDQGQHPTSVQLLSTAWRSYYTYIGRCNSLIAVCEGDQITWGDETVRARVIAEARLLRALCYFDMARMWENVPLMRTPEDDANQPQADPDELYTFIIEDLKFAQANIPADAYPKSDMANNEGRVTRYAADGLLARVYLYYTGFYGQEHPSLPKSDAVDALDDIIRSNEYELLADFADLWPAASSVSMPGDAEEWDAELTTYQRVNREVILQMQFNYTDDRYNNYPGSSVSYEQQGNAWLVMFGLRKINCSPYGTGWGCGTVNPKTVKAFDETDPRRKASIIDIEGEGIFDRLNAGTFDNKQDYMRDQREYTGYSIKKYLPTCWANGFSTIPEHHSTGAVMEYQTQPFVILRYADVLLMAAELGGTPSITAQAALDKVRDRVGMPHVVANKDNIMKERQLELAFEANRYWDLMRQGIDVAANAVAENTTVLTGGREVRYTVNAANFRAKRGLMQIPADQISLSGGVLKQNPGW